MDIKHLFKGVAVVIDDKINDPESGDLILNIIEKLNEENIPLLKYDDIPEDSVITHLNNINFLLLDWELFEKPEGAYFDEKPFIENVINFIKKLKSITFVPVFIFSHIGADGIINKLEENGLYDKEKRNYIFVKSKNELISETNDNKLFEEIEEWLKQTPSIYALKEWEKSLNKAKNKLFWDFYNINHKWPSVLQKTFQDDGSDVNYELGNFIFKNIMARTEPIEFEEYILNIEDSDLTKNEIRKVLEAERFIKSDSLPPDIPFTGDLFKIYKYELSENATSEKEFYFINVRPDCDIAIRNGHKNPKLYCLECEIIDEDRINSGNKNQIIFDKGTFIEKTVNTYLPFIESGKIFAIKFKDLKIYAWKQKLFPKQKNGGRREFKEARLGRILPPYITAIQQKYSFYLQRQGLPAIPVKAIKEE